MLNKSFFLGRLTKDPELTKTEKGASRTRFNIAVQKDYVQDGESVDYIPIVCWNRLAESVNLYCYKGRMVLVEAHIQTRSYNGSQGQRKFVMDIIADKVTFLGSGKKDDSSLEENTTNLDVNENSYEIKEDDINF